MCRKQRVVLGEIKSEWVEVESGVPQGSVLGPLLFVLYINDLPDRVKNQVKLYADDSKIMAVIKDWEDATNLQNDLSSICEWSKDWMMQLNVSKCKVMHFGRSNPNFDYYLKDSENVTKCLEKTKQEKDLGVTFTPDLSWKEHILEITARANRILGSLKEAFVNRDSHLWKNLYISLVRPHLEYAVQVWSPTKEMDIGLIEKVQARATKIPHSMRNLSYQMRLKRWGINRLEDRRVRGDLIEMYKSVNGLDEINWERNPVVNTPKFGVITRSNGVKIKRDTFKSRIRNDFARQVSARHNYFINRITPAWNALPKKIVQSPTLNIFKKGLDDRFKSNGRYS